MKTCRNCWVTREIEFFNSNWYSRNWKKTYKPFCKYCQSIMQKNSRKPEIVIIRWKVFEKEKETNIKLKEKKRQHYKENREKLLAYKREFYANLSEDKKQKIIRRVSLLSKKRLWQIEV